MRYQSHMRAVFSSQIGDDITVFMFCQNVSSTFESRRPMGGRHHQKYKDVK